MPIACTKWRSAAGFVPPMNPEGFVPPMNPECYGIMILKTLFAQPLVREELNRSPTITPYWSLLSSLQSKQNCFKINLGFSKQYMLDDEVVSGTAPRDMGTSPASVQLEVTGNDDNLGHLSREQREMLCGGGVLRFLPTPKYLVSNTHQIFPTIKRVIWFMV